MANDYATLTERLVTELSSALAGTYGGLVVERRNWDPARLPAFDRYAIIVSPDQRPVTERRTAVASIQYLLRAHLYMLVRNWEDTFPEPALWGTTAGELGLFELVKDVKDHLRLSDLGGLLDKTYDEAAGDAQSPGQGGGSVEYGTLIPGFTASEYALLYPARIPYLARTKSFCHARL
jgi:hypothetical protein